MELDLLQKLADPYERKARLTPALLALIPVFGVIFGQYGVALRIEESLLALLASAGVFYLFASIARELGKRLEDRLFASWGGKPTTQLLRHRDRILDPVSKARYHAFLAKRLKTPFPDTDQERNDRKNADHIYESGAKWLIEQTRDKSKFSLLLKENIAYGFRRNALGLKPIALVIALGALLWVPISTGALTTAAFAPAILTVGAWCSIVASLAALAVWLFFFTKKTVRTAAFIYADTLLRACDALEN